MKTDDLIKEYQELYLKIKGTVPTITRAGGWIYIDRPDIPSAIRPYKLKELMSNLERQYQRGLIDSRIKEDEEEGIFQFQSTDDEIKSLVKDIKILGKQIFINKTIKPSQVMGREISKKAKRILNLLGDK